MKSNEEVLGDKGKSENKYRKFQWLPILLITWNLFDLVLHVAIDMAEPYRIAGNVVAIVAALIVLLANVKSYAPLILGGAAVVVVALNAFHASEHGFAIPMLVFIGVTLFLLLRWAQVKSLEANAESENEVGHFYHRWWMAIIVSLVGVAIVVLTGMSADVERGLPLAPLDDVVLDSALLEQSNITPGPNDTDLYTTVNAAEHADYARSHIFEYAIFGGSFDEDASNQTIVRATTADYPGAYNVVTRNPGEIFVYYGVYGDVEGSTGPAVALLDANTLEEVWNTQLAVYENETAWNYPGVVGLHGNGTLIVVSGNTAAVLDPDTGNIINKVDLPQVDPALGSYNGFATTSDGTLFTKALFRYCDDEGGLALKNCLDTEATQTLLALDPVSLEIITQVELPVFSTGRIPIAVHDGIDHVYMPGISEVYRYRWENQSLVLEEDWGFVSVTEEDDLGAMAPNVIGDWVFVQVNTGTPKPMPVWAISAVDSSERFMIRPFEDIETRFSFGVAHGAFDTESGLLFTADTGTGYVSAMTFDPESGFEVVWREEQTTSVFQQLIGDPDERVVVTSDLLNFRLNPLTATNEQILFRDAATGRELARTGNLPRMSDGANISPGFGGRMYFPGKDGRIYEVSVQME
jgi:hypothetical protein